MKRELISKLYTDAVEYCVEQGPNPDGTNKAWIWEEKFAELIVQQCLAACSRSNEIRSFVPPTRQQVVLDCMREIENTFGVEE